MNVRRMAALVFIAFLVSGVVFAGERVKTHISPYMGSGNLSVDAESSYGATNEISMSNFVLGFDIFVEKQMRNPKLYIGADFNYQYMDVSEMDINDTEYTGLDVSVSSIFIGPSLRYFLTDSLYFLGTTGLVILWSSGEDDYVDSTLFGPGFSAGIGYDFPSMRKAQFGLYARILFYLAYGEDSDLELDYSSRYMSPIFGFSIVF